MGSSTADTGTPSAAVDGADVEARVAVDRTTRLTTDVHLPARVPAAGVPTILLRTPYGRRGEIDRVAALSRAAREAGFALVAQDVRGTSGSDGVGLPFVHEVTDGAATLDWLAGQRWSNGTVIPYGDSYCGFTAWAAAATQAESVGAVVARVTTTDVAGEWFHPDGVTRLQLNLPWLDFAFGDRDLAPLEQWRQLPATAATEHLPEDLQAYLRATAGGVWDAVPTPRQLRAARAPVLHWTGWYDCLGRGQIRDHLARRRAGRVDDVLRVGPTDHEFRGVQGDVPGQDHVEDLMRTIRTAYDVAVGRERVPRSRVAPVGPAAALSPGFRLHLADGGHAGHGPEGGALTEVADPLPETFAWTDDPADPHPTSIGWLWGALRDGLPDQRRAHVRPDVATFTGPEHRGADTTLVGHVVLRLPVRVARDGAAVVATLCDVHPDGYAVPLTWGAARVVKRTGWSPTTVDLGYVGHTLSAGHRLRLAVSSRSHPGYAVLDQPPHPETEDVMAQTGPAAHLDLDLVPELTEAYRAGEQA